mmetsp:Transcript_5895/g.10639  ORF Transcript_5895/g.10639 Transcript_5895/m.10639 type:complete len:216 (-) Transcript_5895:403-1050(-)
MPRALMPRPATALAGVHFLASRASRTALKSASPWPLALADLYISFAAAATGVAWANCSPRAIARRMSFCWCFRGNAVGYLRSAIAGPFRLNMGDVMAPREMTSSRSFFCSPLCSARVRPSAKAAIMLPITILTTSFMWAPFPASPRKKLAFPMTSRAGVAASNSSLSPPVKKIKVPCSAGPLEPETGASRNLPPLALIAASMALAVSASTVDTST